MSAQPLHNLRSRSEAMNGREAFEKTLDELDKHDPPRIEGVMQNPPPCEDVCSRSEASDRPLPFNLEHEIWLKEHSQGNCEH